MLYEEAVWIAEFIRGLNLNRNHTVMDIGSAGEDHRCMAQPFIDYLIFRPLREKGCTVFYVDAAKEKGVDIVWNVSAEQPPANLKPADLVVCTSLLEHVEDPVPVIERIKKLIKPGGYLILTVPRAFPYHPHPIDTMYRPDPQELEKFFDGYKIVNSTVIKCGSVEVPPGWKERQLKRIFNRFGMAITRRVWPKVSALIVQKPGEAGFPDDRSMNSYVPDEYTGHAGIEMDLEAQLEKLKKWKSSYPALFKTLREDPQINTQCPGKNYLHNGAYPTPDAEIYAAMIADYRPENIIEIGVGFSTRIARRVVTELRLPCKITAIDPHPNADVKGAADQVLLSPVEKTDLKQITAREKLLLFIDSSHLVEAGGDGPFLYNQVLPALRPGTLVHVHDIFIPYDYPLRYKKLGYNEQYILQTLLADSNRYRVVFSTQCMSRKYPELMQSVFSEVTGKEDLYFGASFWFEVKQ